MFSYGRRQEQLVEQGMVEVMYNTGCRRGCKAVMAYEYYGTLANAKKRAYTVSQVYGKALVNDFAGYSVLF